MFGAAGGCLFRYWTNKSWCSTRIYLKAAPLPNINNLPQALNKSGSYLYADNKYVEKKNQKIFRHSVNGL